jgi:hypothetical protein
MSARNDSDLLSSVVVVEVLFAVDESTQEAAVQVAENEILVFVHLSSSVEL